VRACQVEREEERAQKVDDPAEYKKAAGEKYRRRRSDQSKENIRENRTIHTGN
jgi:hypothetical protein